MRIAKLTGLALLDTKCARVDGSAIEPCDLFDSRGQFIHVKRKTRSATLSHLFAQGTVSAECFISDAEFRKNLRKCLEEQGGRFYQAIPLDRPEPSRFGVIYAIITKRSKDWPLNLPFFSRLNLMNAAHHLARLSFKVSLIRIEEAQ